MGLFGWLFGSRDKRPANNANAPSDNGTILVNAYATVRTLPRLDFPHEFHNSRDIFDPEMVEHLRGLAGFIMRSFDGKMTSGRYHLLGHARRVRNQISFSIKQDDVEGMDAWARAANAILFLPDGSIRTPDMSIILTSTGAVVDGAQLPYPADAVARRARTLEHLAGMKPAPPVSMPPSLGEDEVVLRPAKDIWQRALGLNFVAMAGAAVCNGDEGLLPNLRREQWMALEALTPAEMRFVDAPDHEAAVALSWRYEALRVVLWALSIGPETLGTASQAAETEDLARQMKENARAGAEGRLKLRPAAEILEALDLAWRQHWIVRQAALNGVELTGLNPFVVQERHLALNWLTGFQNGDDTPWDEIDTPT